MKIPSSLRRRNKELFLKIKILRHIKLIGELGKLDLIHEPNPS
jgi:hypothetical protein